ncbi:hypothetical protein VF14_35510 [Nostoc linckia z18]|jgi:uncharacterized protein YukE|uniref:Uncharacterized protein n=2 Tax=Nostoc linckia TaxID=92942 RepID=A0A9Q6EIF7_NOSLI|nr:hypothetical protein [Nostoc linckia]PHK28163.1 hypothetical protein VF12_33390 [Nostoc linckia z15]PHK38663.1 hypothetical protein VF13_35645 [Nostoc linckia z16]PHJ55945.1 hypothetical protein VF02_34675 [Nostoc linckia z1]PHJ56339.1 hypothetical protein VF05_37380 [Nostoc linckia z3]PHJ71911.1 hypothetical protein VF03_19175 [Nostoc linckia z2]
MARAKRTSRTLDKAEVRLASVKSINPTLEVREGLSVKDYTDRIESLRESIEEYNTALSNIDILLTHIVESEKDLADYSDQFLRGIAYKFGHNSDEYYKAGGVRKSDRKRPVRQSAVLPAS